MSTLERDKMIRQSVDVPTRVIRINGREYSITRRGKRFDVDGFESLLPGDTTFGRGTIESEYNRGKRSNH